MQCEMFLSAVVQFSSSEQNNVSREQLCFCKTGFDSLAELKKNEIQNRLHKEKSIVVLPTCSFSS